MNLEARLSLLEQAQHLTIQVLLLSNQLFSQRINAMSAQLDALTAKVNEASDAMGHAATTIAQLKADKAALETQVADLQDQIANAPAGEDLTEVTNLLAVATDALKAADPA